MKCSKDVRKRLVLSIFFLLIMAIGLISKFSPNTFSSFATIENVWSGNVATSFYGGNGTKENPFLISSGEELAYFEKLINSANNSNYLSASYELTTDINMAGLPFNSIGDENNLFKGVFDGNGYSITNLNIISPNNNYALFYGFDKAEFKNINLIDLEINVDNSDSANASLLAIDVKNKSVVDNVSINNSRINVLDNNETTIISGLANNIEDSNVNHTIIDVTFNKTDAYSIAYNVNNSKFNNILVYNHDYPYTSNSSSLVNILGVDKVDEFIEEANESVEKKNFEWVSDGDNVFINQKAPAIMALFLMPKNISLTASGIQGNIVYVNDLESDYNYYMGLNYTYSSDSKTPSLDKKDIYTDKNLVNVQITYNGVDSSRENERHGYVSLTERQDTYVYYKTMMIHKGSATALSKQDYVEIELIDNPFTDRPDGSGFNGWVTDYPNAKVIYNSDIYVRTAVVPITYDASGYPNDLIIDFKASWTDATVYDMPSSSPSFSTAMSAFKDTSMQELKTYEIVQELRQIYSDTLDMSKYYTRENVGRFSSQNGYYDINGKALSGICTTNGGCTVYQNQAGKTYASNKTYYTLNNGTMKQATISGPPYYVGEELVDVEHVFFKEDAVMSSYYEKVVLSRNASIIGLYDANGVYQKSGTCTQTSCTYYRLIQYYDDNGHINTFDKNKTYYYLVTRDTNILVLRNSLTATITNNQTKPVTITGLYHNTNYNPTWTLSNSYIAAYDDLVLENVTLAIGNQSPAEAAPTSTSSSSTGTGRTGNFYGRWFNVKIGRGIKRTSTARVNFSVAMGGDNSATGSSNSVTNYRFIVESGFYNTLSLTGGTNTSNTYIDGTAIYGNDYDRVSNNNNNLDVYYCASGSWGSTVYKSGANSIAIHSIIKSGKFGSSRPTDYSNSNTNSYTYGVYVGGRNGGAHYAAKEAIIEGGWIYNLVGGPLSQSTNKTYNDVYIYVKGGEVDAIYGGAGRTQTYGNRIIQVTDGTINNSVFGGSNGITSETSTTSTQTGTLDGNSYIYIGGNAVIGKQANVNNNVKLYGFEAGSVFGIGNGKSGSSSIGSANNSNIIIDGNARVLRNVYGGGNYGAVGLKSSSRTNIRLIGGTVLGSVYGGGNNNGSGTSSYKSSIDIQVNGGNVSGSLYGGANESGIVYGNVNINLLKGVITNDVFGGGYGGYQNNTYTGTYVSDAILIQANGSQGESIQVNGSIYGGSAFGTVNSTNNTSTTKSSSGITINFNEGIVSGAIFGGGEGSTNYTPRVNGDILVNINGGNIGEVYGGNNAAGKPIGDITINLNGGIINNVYGGGMNASVSDNHIYLKGSTIQDSLYGGSNNSGTVDESNILVTSGSTTNVYGGNNVKGNTIKSNVTINGGTISKAVYGGGNKASTGETYVYLNSSNIPQVFGGGADADVTTSTNVYLQGSTVGDLFGGSNAGGNIDVANVFLKSGTSTNVYGGNNEDGITNESFITQTGTDVLSSIYGGGNKIGVNTTHIDLYGGNINNVYGGSNQSGEVKESYIRTPKTNTGDVTMNVTKEKSWDASPYTSRSHLTVSLINNTKAEIVKWDVKIRTTNAVLSDNWSAYDMKNKGTQISFNQTDKYNGSANALSAFGIITVDFYTGNYTSYDKFDILSYEFVGYDANGKKYEYGYPRASVDGSGELVVGNLYGGNNLGGTTGNTNIDVDKGTITNIFGGGNQAIVTENTVVNITDAEILTSVYGGGNQAGVLGNTLVNVDGTTSVAESVFGGGNHGSVGNQSIDNAHAIVNIAGAIIGKNVYGGCNTSEIYGSTKVNIGYVATNEYGLDSNNISIGGTVFGGGEANEAGSEIIDFDHISVTQGIDINIDGTDYEDNDYLFQISGSIFGSGNASCSQGPSNIYVGKLGTRQHPNTSVSIQRADVVVIDNSSIELIGTTDSTNQVSTTKLYSLNKIKKLIIKNDTDLLLRNNANKLEEFSSLVDINGEEVKAAVTIDDETKTVTSNVNNRLYMLAGSKLNVATNEDATTFGNVYGMTFFGMYNTYGNGSYVYGMYDSSMSYGSSATAGDVITDGSYVVGLHALDHDITVDGFYTNYIDDDYTVLTTAYINPIPPDSNYYMWEIGTPSIKYEVELLAARYSSLGTAVLNLDRFPEGNVTFNVIGFNGDGLTEGVELRDSNFVSKLTSTQEEADNVLGLAMKSETIEWTNQGTTKFMKDSTSYYSGDTSYKTDNQSLAPSLMFYLYHAKNITPELTLGSAVITLQALVPKDVVEYDVKLVTITVTILSVEIADADAYDASITYSKKYDLPVATDVNITNKSQFTTYFALLASAESINQYYGRNANNYHTLISSYALPVGTKITMIDYGYNDELPNYYYFIVDEDNYKASVAELKRENEIAYRLSNFIRMDSVDKNNTYNDQENNQVYYHDNINFINEEFVFIFDFQDTNISENSLDNTILFELRKSLDREETVFNVWGQRRDLMKYSLYDSSNEVLVGEYSFDNNYFYYDNPTRISTTTIISYDQTDLRQAIVDTNYESSSMGLNIEFYDVHGIQASSSQLSSASIQMEGQTYYVDSNGVFRIKLADKVSNLNKEIIFTTGDTLPVGAYKMRISLFASNDGLHNSGDKEPSVTEYDIVIVGNNNMIMVTTDEKNQIVDGHTGLNSLGTNVEQFNITYSSVLSNPNIRVAVYKRSTTGSNSSNYVEYNARELFVTPFYYPSSPYNASSAFEYMVSSSPTDSIQLSYKLNTDLKSGTYKIVFRLYDSNQLIDEDYKYIIIRKNVWE